MRGHDQDGVSFAHVDTRSEVFVREPMKREERERLERTVLSVGAAHAEGAGRRDLAEEADEFRTCFEKDRDRIIHSPAFRRLAGKTQVVVYPTDHQRTRLTHALEVAQVAGAIARGVAANPGLTQAIALGHDCGHGPGGHASEDAFDAYVPGGYLHSVWGADVVLRPLNLCQETLDGIRNHSWSRPAPTTVEGEIVSWADRIAYCAHDLEDALHAGIVVADQLPHQVTTVVGSRRSQQLRVFITAVITATTREHRVCMETDVAAALAALRQFNYERIYMRDESVAQAEAVVAVLRGLVDHYIAHPDLLPQPADDVADAVPGCDLGVARAVAYVAGMTDRFAFERAEELLGFDPAQIPVGIGRGA
ncbi:MAG: HD domain-containing protein [Propionibacteriaceae bacterium]|jgi:dGTPase|nr:HD domain-containing protein [Propionibacteriaceae bacterium]